MANVVSVSGVVEKSVRESVGIVIDGVVGSVLVNLALIFEIVTLLIFFIVVTESASVGIIDCVTLVNSVDDFEISQCFPV